MLYKNLSAEICVWDEYLLLGRTNDHFCDKMRLSHASILIDLTDSHHSDMALLAFETP